MSLINDALKKASKSAQDQAEGSSTEGLQPAGEPASTAPKKSVGTTLLLLCLLVAVAAGWGVWTIWQSRARKQAAATATTAASAKKPSSTKAGDKTAGTSAAGKMTDSRQMAGTNKKTNKVDSATAKLSKTSTETKAAAETTKPVMAAKTTTETKSATGSGDLGAAPALGKETPRQVASAANVQITPPPTTVSKPAEIEKKVEFPTLKLQGIYYRLSKPSARINGQTVYTGDTVAGAKVVTINRESVLLQFEGENKEIRF